jgi:hypothetical protein
VLIDDAISVDKNMAKKRAEETKIQRPYNRHAAHVECKNKSDNTGDCNHFRITQTEPKQHTEKAQQEATDNSHSGHCTGT